MHTLTRIKEYVLDFLFPSSPSLLTLESLSPHALLSTLPRAQDLEEYIALFDYKDELVRELIWELKYKGNQKSIDTLAAVLLDVLRFEIAEHALESKKWRHPLLIPLPISSERRRKRGWNQTELLGDALMKLDSDLCIYRKDLLMKERHTDSQARTHATKREREENLYGSMKALPDPLYKEHAVILLDDVTTSGSTFKEATRALKAVGATRILCVAIAH